MGVSIVANGLAMATATLFVLDLALPAASWRETRASVARTMAFTALVCPARERFNSRSDHQSVPWPVLEPAAVGCRRLSALLQVAVVHLPFLNTAFGTEPLTRGAVGIAIGGASVVCGCRRRESS